MSWQFMFVCGRGSVGARRVVPIFYFFKDEIKRFCIPICHFSQV